MAKKRQGQRAAAAREGIDLKRNAAGGEADETLVDIVEVRDQAKGFFEENRNIILGVAVGLFVLVLGFFLYQSFVKLPAEKEAASQLQQAQLQFEQDSFQLALINPGPGFPGFLDIIDQYGSTVAGNLASYYAGVSYLNLGDYPAAADYLEDFDPAGKITPIMKYGTLGDAYSEMDRMDDALDAYETAVEKAGENFLLGGYYLKKLGLLYRHQGQNDEALAAFRRLKADYPESPESGDADKYIALLEAATN